MTLTLNHWQDLCAAPQQHVASDWGDVVRFFFASSAAQALHTHIDQRLKRGVTIYPAQPLRCLMETPLHTVRVVILGQDPYHGVDKYTGQPQAEGLAFSVAQGAAFPPSLRNIFKERQRDIGDADAPMPMHGSLIDWAHNGVLLLNACLTVEAGLPASHAKLGWEVLTDTVISAVAARETPTVFMLWGAHAQGKAGLIAAHNLDNRHLVLSANHPSPLSALRPPVPFIGCGHFGKAQRWLCDRQHSSATIFASP